MRIVVTGGCGFVGSHVAVRLLQQGHEVLIADDLSNSNETVVPRVQAAAASATAPEFHQIDLRDGQRTLGMFKQFHPDAVVHCAGVKSVSESIADPSRYYEINLGTTFSLLDAMDAVGTDTLVFSSSATVYGWPSELPLTEQADVGIKLSNPYGRSKFMIEQILADYAVARPEARVVALRYFNPVGAHESGLLGEEPRGVPSNLLPYLLSVAAGERDALNVFGNDYPTPDGTGVRDYIHVEDLAGAHVAAIQSAVGGFQAVNIGTGQGVSVLQLIRTFERVTGVTVPFKMMPRRPGDVAEAVASVDRARRDLHWQASLSIEQACLDAWRSHRLRAAENFSTAG